MARASRVMRLILSAATAALCLLLCWQAVDIYLAGNSPDNFSAPGVRIRPVYSRELVGERLAAISPALIVYVVLAASGLVLQAAGDEKPRPRAVLMEEERLGQLRRRAAQVPPQALAERKRRRDLYLAGGVVILCCVLLSGAYLLNGGNFASLDLEHVVGRMLLHILPWVALGLAAAAAVSVLAGRSVLREIDLLKAAPKGEAEPAPEAGRKLPLPAVRIALYAAAVLLIVLGVSNGGLWDVLVKAVNICTECIGLG